MVRLAEKQNTNILSLEQAVDPALCGGKAARLAGAVALGLPVPAGFVVTNNAFQEFCEEGGLGRRVKALLETLGTDEPARLHAASRTIRDWVLSTPLPHSLSERVVALWRDSLDGETLIIRSSGIGEDSSEGSYAGQLDSFPNIQNESEISDMLRRCWASFWSARAISYQSSTGLQLKGMGIIVQRQVDAALAGVLFTRSPVRQEAEAMIGEYCYGLGETLVSGKINPGRFEISRGDFSLHHLAAPEQQKPEKIGLDLTIETARELGHAAVALEQHFLGPQDIEWAIGGTGMLFIVQSRPIVSLAANAREKVMLTWSNANVQENFPDPITPLLYSVASAGYTHYFRNLGKAFGISRRRIAAMDSSFANIIAVHGARMYYNLTSIHAVIRLAPFGERLIRYFNDFVGATETTRPSDNAKQFFDQERNRVLVGLELFRIIVSTAWRFLFLTKRVGKFEAIVEDFASETEPSSLADTSLPKLHENLRTFMDIRLHRWTNASLADAASMISYGLLQSLLQRFFRSEDQASLTNNLLKGVTGLVSSEPVMDLWSLSRIVRNDPLVSELFNTKGSSEIARILAAPDQEERYREFASAFDEFLSKWGYRCSGELMLTVPSFQENATGLIDILKTYVQLDGDSPREVLNKQKAEREALTREVLAKLSQEKMRIPGANRLSAFLVKRVIEWTQKSVSLRERARLKQALLYSRLRRISLAIGEHLAEREMIKRADEVFFLTYSEIDDLLSSRSMFPYRIHDLVSLRKSEHKALSSMILPDSFVMEESTFLEPALFESGKDTGAEQAIGGENLKGTTACGGKIKGRATVLRDVAESEQLEAGDVLVTTQTDPGWAHVFFLIKGLVIERGGMLSHGAILAREFGIPAVVGIRNATELIPQHAQVYLDADRGRVRILD